jgi:branched-chain amino acid transport system substrate-binding protein
MKKFLILYDCGISRIFEDGKYNYVFRTAAHATMDNVALARYLKSKNIPVKSFNMINQDYAWGQDSRTDFILSMAKAVSRCKTWRRLVTKIWSWSIRHRNFSPHGQTCGPWCTPAYGVEIYKL